MTNLNRLLVLSVLISLRLTVPEDLLALENDSVLVETIAGIPEITNYKSGTYKANPHNFATVQDRNGIMFFGNLWGLLEFDGSKWSRMVLPNGVSCTSLAKDKKGTIYVGGRNEIGYLKETASGAVTYISLRNKIPKRYGFFNELWKTFCTPSGVYFFSFEGLFFMPDGADSITRVGSSIRNIFLVNGHIYVLNQRGICELSQGTFKPLIPSSLLKGNLVTDMVYDKGRYILLCGEGGLFEYDGVHFRPWESEINQQFRHSDFDKVYIIKKYLIFSTLLNGVIISDTTGKVLFHLDKSNGLLSNTTSGCYLDRDQNLWITSETGISYTPLHNQLFLINDYMGVSGTPYSSAIYDNYLYLATSEGIFKKSLSKNAGSIKDTYQKVKGISGLVWQLFVYDHRLFCGHATGAYVIDHNRVRKLYNQGTWLFLPLDDPNRMLIGTYNGLALLVKERGAWVFRNRIKGFDESSRFVVRDRYGDFWVSHGNKGVYQIRLNYLQDSAIRVVHYGKNNGLPEDYDNTVFSLNHKILISGTQGVYRYDFNTEKIIPYSALNEIIGSGKHIEKIIAYSPHSFWVIFDQGTIAMIRIGKNKSPELVWESKTFKYKLIEAFEHLDPINENDLILGTQDGFAILKKIQRHRQDKAHFDCYITKFQAENNLLYSGFNKGTARIKESLPYAEKTLRFTFTATAYDDIESTQYQYYLEGFDDNKNWSDWTNVPFKEYTNLKEGDYAFHVRAQNSGTMISKESVLRFTVLPPWYRSWYAYLAYLLLALLAIYSIGYRIKKKHEREKRKMELEKQRKLWEQQKEWEKASLIKEKELMLLQQEKLKAEAIALRQKEDLLKQEEEKERMILEREREKMETIMGSKNNELKSLTIQISHKNELLNKIKNSIHKSVKESTDPETRKILNHAKMLLDKGLNSAREWELFRMHFNNVHEGFFKNLQHDFPDLKPSSLKLCAYLKMRLSSKQISSLTNTSPDSVIKARYRLRKKFNLSKDMGLEEFLNKY